METNLQADAVVEALPKALTLKVFGVGSAGLNIMRQMMNGGTNGLAYAAVNTDAASLAGWSGAEKVCLENKLLRGLGTGGDPERGRTLAEDHAAKLKELCQGVDGVFIVTGLGGGAGTGISPVLARVAKECGALVLAFVVTPFECEGSRRQRVAQHGLELLKEAADGVICLPHQRVFKLIDENTSVLDTFKLTNDLLADGVRGLWRLLAYPGLIELHFEDVCALLRDKHTESAFAVAEAVGPTRSREVADKLFAHPMLDGGQVITNSEAVLVSLSGGPDLTMAEVNRVMEAINAKCEHAQVLMGAAIDEAFRDRLAVTLIASRKVVEQEQVAPRLTGEQLNTQLLSSSETTERPHSRFVPPAPALPQEQLEQIFARQSRGGSRARKPNPKMRQAQLPLEILTKGRFDKSEPTVHKGEDLDVPTYVRRGVPLN